MKKHHWLKIAGIVVAVLLVILVALPFMINVDSFRPRIQSEASAALGREVTLGKLSLSILSSTVKADDISIADDPAFATTPFVKAESLKVGVELKPLIFSKEIKVTEIVLEKPEINLIRGPNGTWNFSNIGSASRNKPDAPKSSGPPNVSVAKLEVNHGRLSIGKLNSALKPQVYDEVNVSVKDFSETSEFPFKLTTNLPGGGDADISGKAGPINAENTAKTPFETAVKVNNMDIAASGFIDPASGIAGLANFDGTLTSTGTMAKAVGTFTGEKLKFGPRATPATKAVVIKHSVDMDLDNQTANITQGDVSVGNTQAHLTGTVRQQGDTQVANLKLSAPGMSVNELEALLPALGVVLPSGSQLSGGTLSANLTITGPLNNYVIAGPLQLQNTALKNFSLGQKLGAISKFVGGAGMGNPDTTIRNFSLNAQVTPQMRQANNINLDVPALGLVTGAGVVSAAGDMNFKMVANLSGGMVGSVAKVTSVGGGSVSKIPFSIQGTTSNPKFIPDVSGIATGVAAGAVQGVLNGGKVPGVPPEAGGLINGLLGGKKKPPK
jgi:AsmA protein